MITHWFNNITVTTVHDGAAALAVCHTQKVDMVIADYQMPEIDGITLARLLYVHPPVRTFILLSGAVDQVHEMHVPGVDRCIAKPTGLPLLRPIIAGALAAQASNAGAIAYYSGEQTH